MEFVKTKIQHKAYDIASFLIRIMAKPVWKDHSNGYLTIFFDYEGKYALPEKEKDSLHGIKNILDINKDHEIKSTFCAVGQLFYDYPEIIFRMIRDGHDIASHTYKHQIIRRLNRTEILADIKSMAAVFRKFGLTLKGMRCPQGRWNFTQLKIMCENGLCWSAERDGSQFPYTVYKYNKKRIIRFPIIMSDYNSFYQDYNPERMYSMLVSMAQHIQKNKIYGAIGFHPWLLGEDDSRIQVMNNFLKYIKNLNNLKIVTFSEAYSLIEP